MTSRDTDAEPFGAPTHLDTTAVDTPADRSPPGGVLSAHYRWVSIGMCLLIMLAAFEALAVTTIMPTVSRELDGASLYAFAFAGPLAVSVVGMVLAGAWSDRGNPRSAMFASVVFFSVGLLVAGTATTMPLFVAGRLIHGLGGGALTVSLYVIVARVYPPRLHPRIFAGFAAAWVVPSLIGPLIAGLLAETVGWRWVFLGVVALVVLAMLMVVPAMRGVHGPDDGADLPPRDLGRIGWAVLVAAAVLVLTLSAEATGPVQWILPPVAAVVAVVAIRPLLPRRTLRAARGLPSVILTRSLVAGTFFAAEVYVPLLLVTQYGMSAALAGLALTAAGLSWAAASWAQGRFEGISNGTAAWLGALGLSIAIGSLIATAALHLPPAVVVVGWAFAGAGMGVLYPRLGVLTLEYSSRDDQGFNSSALSIADSIGSAISLAATAIVFAALGAAAGGAVPFVGAFAFTGVLCALAWMVGPRILRR
ncbi:MFS transporter [Leifsonia sp. ZF2019]|uniref:MFS transporter n=1 Tax=Leifsonia sp. ZF2019 TaxID=2781978 RepID=UPI001CBE18B0|nr:MFS transporter [Leifsonia sp. ZF2019]UAJ80348.1 MFS transporter [Leifsonia sp. ZF2019]